MDPDLRPRPVNPEEREETIPPPTGTLFFVMVYIMVMAGMWLAIFFEFLGR